MLEAVPLALLAAGTVVVVLSCAAFAAADDAFAKLHFLGPSTTIGAVLIAGGIVAAQGLEPLAFKAVVVALLLLFSGPTSSHALARAWRIRSSGSWKLDDDASDGQAGSGPSEGAAR